MKQKTHKGTAKRIKVSGSGKLLRNQAGKRHLNESMTSKRRRNLKGDASVAQADVKRVNRLLGRS
ncbi:50S ribosomal protein L35 [Corynebacterium camporealensis]|uniref:Large ribosomal subunit protein bL35 n=1 Tax=Corynebacterium camporealensis TaxID=161896 RepID=A0A0F6QY65_9CORY|nr:50S ribosomal protein L35 [Corynebacterium camporealensis]AKE39078.1 ribosomal protein L35 [Corynebacterium camporealensis]AVH88302.1 50S ribosomal protein L35 [Corynebacterium camporealensis]MDY5839531.1 50S ribosomal protein L35 [Corynebacterium camporealensis]